MKENHRVPGLKKTTITIYAEPHRQLKMLAAELGLDLSKMITELVKEYRKGKK